MSNKQSLTEKEVLKLIEANKHQDEKPKYRTGYIIFDAILTLLLIVYLLIEVIKVF